MSDKLDPKKAVTLKPGQRTLPGKKRRKAQTCARPSSAQRRGSNGAGE